MVAFTKHDLQFILDGITVSETHASSTNTIITTINGDVWTVADLETSRQILLDLVPNSLEPIGMRTITGELNNLVIGQEDFGALGEFPRLLDPDYRDDATTGNTETPFGFGPMGPFVTNTDYANSDGDSFNGAPGPVSNGDVVDSDPRIISNLIVDQTTNNPVAVYAAGLNDGSELNGDLFFIPNVAPDEGLSAPFNSWMTLFGQFFDHGLDLVNKGGSGTVYMPLQPDDPLYVEGGFTNFMVLTRASVDPGPDGVIGTDDDVSDAVNKTSPFVDQNQTYTSHPSHQIFVREYELEDRGDGLRPYSTGALIEGAGGGMATWGEVKEQARDLLGFELTDREGLDIPLFAVDQYGEFIRGANGLPQIVMADGTLVEGNLTTPVVIDSSAGAPGTIDGAEIAPRTGFSFLLDIAHEANPIDSQTGAFLSADTDTEVGLSEPGAYDNELLDAHFIAGDGRANENIGLTAVHHVFHQEHNRLVEQTKEVLLSSLNNADLGTVGDEDGAIAALEVLNGYLEVPVTAIPTTQAQIDALIWDGDRLFQAAKFGTEMQYQHLVFEEFARKVQPLVDLFASYETSIDAKIVAEFAHTVYRFGHSMLTETVDLMDTEGNLTEVGLIEAFLNPFGFNQAVNEMGQVSEADILAQDSSIAAGAIIRGMTRQTGNEIDEFVTEALRNNLLGLPLDLAAINIARGRDTGIPTLNDARADFYAGTGDTKLKPYDDWVDFAQNMKHGGASIVNFIAAYGQHSLVLSATSVEQKRAAALAITTGVDQSGTDSLGNAYNFVAPTDRLEFLNSTGAWETAETGLNLVDFWIGGLAEAIEPFGGMLGSTFNFVFEQQLEDLQDGDRFYYLGRVAGLNFLSQLEQNSLANMIIRNTDIGDNGGDHLPGDIFSTPAFILEVDQSLQITGLPSPDVAIMESGTVMVENADGATWQTITFDQPIENAVVSMMINTLSDIDPATIRVRNITDTGFEFQIDEYDYLDGIHGTETISWVAVAAGEHVLSDGTIIKAGTVEEDAAGNSNVAFGGTETFSGAPIVLTQVSTVNEDTAILTRVQTIDANGFNLRLSEQEAGAGVNGGTHATETVGWIAIEAGDGTLLSTGLTGDGVNHNTANITHNGGFANTVFIAQMQTRDGGDPATVRGVSFDGTNASLFIEEEASADAETNHTGENVGYLVLPTGVITTPGALNADPVNDPLAPGEVNPFLDIGGNSLVIREDLDNDGDNDLLHYTGGDHVVLGGTEENDTIIGSIGDDTLWGDGGDDNLEGGDGGDIILGGDGDDVITDIGGVNNLQGQDGNDAISAGPGEALILAGAGKDFVLQGADLAETFGGLGDDFIHAGTESNILFGNEGNDWLEGGGGNNLLVGDNGDPFLNSTSGGHDVFISGQGDDDYDSEGGDDIMEGADGIQRFEGLNGFDWATYKDVDQGVSADMLLRAFDETPLPPSNVSIQDRFDSVEGLSGGRGGDILRGSNQTAVEIATINNGNNSVLRNFDLIQGLREGDFGGAFDGNTIFDAATTEWGEGDIILGGAGSDIIEGREGNDIIDGDLKLDVRLLIRDSGGAPIATAFKMLGDLYAVDANGTPLTDINGDYIPAPLGPNGEYASLNDAVFNRAVNPGNIEILREIIDESEMSDFDTAQFSDVFANYTIDLTPNAEGFIRIQHDSVAGANDGLGIDGTDLVRGIERLQFADQVINLSANNTVATGMPQIVDPVSGLPVTTPAIGQEVRATQGDIFDADGTTTSTFVYTWQMEESPGEGDWVDIIILTVSGDDAPLTGEVVTLPDEVLGLAIRVVASFQDDAGVIEQVVSLPTDLVGNSVAPTGTAGADILLGTPFDDVINGGAGNDEIFGLAGNDVLRGQADDDVIEGGLGNDIISGGGGLDELFGGDGMDTIDGNGGADLLDGGDGNDLLRGGGGADELLGGAGDDDLRGNAGADEISGGTGNDDIRGGGGNDEILWVAGDGRDTVDGGGGNADVFDITGDAAIAETFRIIAVTPPNPDPGLGPIAAGTEIIVTRNDGSGETIIAELQRIEELVINGVDVDANGGAAVGDTILVSGDFTNTSLALNTITINGTTGDDTVDITGLSSAHRIVFRTNGGQDMVVGQLRAQDVIEVAPGLTPADYDAPVYDSNTGLWTITQTGGGHSISYPGTPTSDQPMLGSSTSNTDNFEFTVDDVRELKNLVRGLPSENLDDDTAHATGIRDLEGTGNNVANPDYGSSDQPFIRLTDAHYGAYDVSIGNFSVNPIFNGLDAREISNILGDQEAGLAKSEEETNIFFMAFGQYFDHGLDFLPKGGNGVLEIGTGAEAGFADLTRGSVHGFDENGVPEHLNKASPFVDQNQAYGSNELVGQFLRESIKLSPTDDHGVAGARLFAGIPDPSNPAFNLLPSMRELIQHHWEMDTMFVHETLPGGQMSFREYFTDWPYADANAPGGVAVGTLVDEFGVINEAMIPAFNGDFMGSGYILVGDANPFINLLDHYVAGDLRANENYTLTSIHTIWARNHNYHVEKLLDAGFDGTAEELFQAAKIVNEVEYQRVVFDEFADVLLGGLKGSGQHGFDDYNPDVDARISHEFAGAAYRFGHSLISQTIEIIDENGQVKEVSLVDVFLNPTNDAEAFTAPLPPGYVPQPGYEQIGVDPVIAGITNQQSEEVDFNLVDAVRNDLVAIRADLFAFNVSRGWDLGLGTLNQIRADLLASEDPYVKEAVDRVGEDLDPYTSWEDFQERNELSDAVIAQFMAAYPDLVLNTPEEIAEFVAANPNIQLTGANNNIVKGIDRVDFWVGGLAEEHVNGGVVGSTFWVVLHEQFDRLQEGDRFYYLDRADEFDFYDFARDEGFAGIIERNTGLEGLPEDIFEVNGDGANDNDNDDDDDTDDDDNDNGNNTGEFIYTDDDVAELLNLVRGLPSENLDDDTAHATGIRDLEGTGNNVANPDFGSSDQPFIRLTDAHYGEFNSSINNFDINPIFDGLDAREISNILGDQEEGLEKSEQQTSIFFMAFGQYFDHGLDFLPKGGNGVLEIGTGAEAGFADLTRGSVDGFDENGVPEHLNKASPFVDQNQAYGSNELVGQFLRESVKLNPTDDHGVAGARLFAGMPDPDNPEFNLLPNMRELIMHHWEMDTMFVHETLPGGQMSFREYFTDWPYEDANAPGGVAVGTLVDEFGVINEAMIPSFNGDFMDSGYILVGDANPFINLLDHYVAGDLRANENVTLTSIHTIWARNHNYHVEKLLEAGFAGNVEELFQAAKIVNEVEYQRVVFDEFADVLLGGLKGSGNHGFDEYNPDVDARISHEFAGAAYRFGHSLISQTIEILDENGNPQEVSLVDVFLNPTNDNEAFTTPLPPGFIPQPGYEQVGVDPIIGGILNQQSEEVDFNLVDAVRNDLVAIRADLFAFNVSRGWDLGLGTLNQIRADLLASDDPYVKEAVDRVGEDLDPYTSWDDFKNRNGLSNAVIAQFMAAYPDLVLNTQEEIDAFMAANPNIQLTGANNNIVKGIDRVDFWVGGLAEEHVNGGVVGSTFWVVLHEQFDRLQEGDRFYYLDRAKDFDFYDFVKDEGFAGIIERNTGLEGLPEDIFEVSDEIADANDNSNDDDDDDDDDDDTDTSDDNDDSGSNSNDDTVDGATSLVALTLTGTELSDTLIGQGGADVLAGMAGDDTLIAGDGDDTVSGGDGNDQIVGNDGNDLLLGGDGEDLIIAGDGNDTIFSGDDNDHIIAGDGDDLVNAGAGDDFVDLGAGDDTVFAALNDGNDVYIGGEGAGDTLDFSSITADVTVDLGNGSFGSAASSQTGTDTISGFEDAIGGAGNDTFIANNAQNSFAGGIGDDMFVFNSATAANGDQITDFTSGDKIDLTGIEAANSFGGDGKFDLLGDAAVFTAAGQLIVRAEGESLRLEGNVDNDLDADFSILISGKSELDSSDFS